ncbi:MAG: hypothetical protein HY561_08975, partial [Gemmatimonadetes bacterium]|nr:hypothetical protein [Gemmatimonadota bacterium]
MEPDVYYHRMSGKYSLGDAVTATLVGAAIAIPLAFIYSYLILYIPFIYLNALFTLGFGIALGVTAFGMLKWRRIRNLKVGTAIAFLVTAAGFYLSWAVWIYALFNRSDVDVALWPIVADPTGLWGVIQSVNEVGAWRFRSYTPTGAVLWGVWAIEAGLIFGIGVVIANHMFADTPFCEECGTWCEKKEGVAAFAADEPAPDADELKHRLEQKDFRLLEQLGPAAEGPG